MYTTAAVIVANLLIVFFANFWGDSNYPDYINTILMVLLILFGAQVFSKKIKKPDYKRQAKAWATKSH